MVKMIEEFRERVKGRGQTFKWVWENYIKNTGVKYQYFLSQVNGCAPIQPGIEEAILKFMEDV